MSPGTEPVDSTYGLDPVHKEAAAASALKSKDHDPLTSLEDRISNLEAMTLAFVAEKGLSLKTVPDVIAFVKAASHDKAALKELSMDRTTASYKLRGGLAPFLQEELLGELRTSHFSLNIDEATSKTNERVLAVLVSYFSPSAKKVVVHHLDAIVLTKITAEILFQQLDNIFVKYGLSWDNLTSVLMDSCAVMRGSKGGLEKLIRDRAPGLLDIDGDTCHHAHNAAKQFCKPFGGVAESLMSDLNTDFKWSAHLKEKLFDICKIVGIKATNPERYVPHRWLSVLDVSVDTLRLMDAYTIFYNSFLRLDDRKLYADILEDVLARNEVSSKGRQSITAIQKELRDKFSTFTKEGKDKKVRITQKCFEGRIELMTTLHVYASRLPCLKEYVLYFQQKEPAMHKLHEKQHELFNEFCKNFLTPESLQNMPHKIDIEDSSNHKVKMSVPWKAAELLKTREGASQKKVLNEKLKQAYVSCALTLQKKMPINNPVLKACAALDPSIRMTSTAQHHLKSLVTKTILISGEDQEQFEEEVNTYTTSPKIPSPPAGTPIDAFWASMDAEEFPLLCEVAKKLLSAFHGPAVESSFSTMGDILNAGSSSLDIATYAAYQTVRYSLDAKKTTAVGFFQKNNPVAEAVPRQLCKKMREAWKVNETRKSDKRQTEMEKRRNLGAPDQNPTTKKSAKEAILETGQSKKRGDQCTPEQPTKKQRTETSTVPQKNNVNIENIEQDLEILKVNSAEKKKTQKTLSSFFSKV